MDKHIYYNQDNVSIVESFFNTENTVVKKVMEGMSSMKHHLQAVLCSVVALFSFGVGSVNADPLSRIASPVSNPVNFEDPRIESNIRPIFAYHSINDNFVTGGGDVQIYALQLRYAINDRLAVIATKDGLVDLNPSAVLPHHTGFANIAGGLKYAFYKDSNSIGSAGLRYEAPTGNKRVLEGEGKGMINPFLSAATSIGSGEYPLNVVGYTGLRIPTASSDSGFYDASLHFDTEIGAISPLVEVNLFHVTSAGDRLPIPDEGQDFFNLGASQSNGETMVTGAAGARVKFCDNISWGAAYEFPIARGPGTRITEWRITTDLIYSF